MFLTGLIILSSTAFAEIKQEPKKFSVTFSVTYNTLTLVEAAEKEAILKQVGKEACTFKVELKEIVENAFVVSSSPYYNFTIQ